MLLKIIMMNVLITGGAGYIGTELTSMLVNNLNIDKIVVYDNLSRENYNLFLHSKIKKGKVKFIKGELLDSRKLRGVLKDIDVVFHLAAKVSTPLASEAPHLFEQINHWGTAELVYAVEESNVSKFFYTSSSSVYGASEKISDINTIPDPKTFYGSSKLRGEEHVERLFNKIQSYILRLGNVYGYGISMRFDAVINRFMFETHFLNRIQIYGNGQQHRAFISINKVTNILNNILTSDLPSGHYNIVDKNISVFEISKTIKEIYPELEMILINQHLSMRELKVKPDERIMKLLTLQETSFSEDLTEFKTKLINSTF